MMKKIFGLSMLLLVAMLMMTCAQNEDKDGYLVTGWKLKLKAFSTFETNGEKRPQPAACGQCFTLVCNSDGSVQGQGVDNSFTAQYAVNGDRISFSNLRVSNSATNVEDEKTYFAFLRLINKFKIKGSDIYLYVENDENYLVFETYDDVKDVAFSTFTLPKGSKWADSMEKGKVYRVDNARELQSLISSEVDGSLPDVDFSKKTVLVVGGLSSKGIENVTYQPIRKGDAYTVEVFVEQNLASVMQPWTVAVVIDKAEAGATFKPDVVYSLSE